MGQSRNKRTIINIGTSLMVVILIGLSFAVIAALAVSSAKNNYDLSNKQAEYTRAYYEASNTINESIADSHWEDAEYDEKISDSQTLHVEVKDHRICCWQVQNDGDWEADDSLTVHIDDSIGF